MSKMHDEYSDKFIQALESKNLDEIRKVPKSDLHNHFPLGGSRKYIKEITRFEYPICDSILSSMQEMHDWMSQNVDNKFRSSEMRKFLIEATFVQAKEDGVTILEIGEDVWGLGEYFNNDIDELISTFQEMNQRIAPEIELRLQIGLSRHCSVDYLMDCLKHFWGKKEFYSIDLYADEFAQPIENFIPIYRLAKDNGLRLKAHIGEWGTAQDVKKAVELLHLDEVQHGIAVVESAEVIRYLVENNIRLNITPSSNLILGRVADMKHHPIQKLYREGVDVTINSDDILIFDSDVSKEYMRLYENDTLTAQELDCIRLNGLKRV
ncbi:MAG: putative adenosine/adenine deaminase [Herbinix sp.]|jgi:adenosine deaminase|nr:putative adenosine/adenine deaminase [Herbinix sp.]